MCVGGSNNDGFNVLRVLKGGDSGGRYGEERGETEIRQIASYLTKIIMCTQLITRLVLHYEQYK